jgi:phage-related tail fiber protein
MSKLARTFQKIFAQNSSKIGQFGSKAAGTKVITTDLTTIQALSAFQGGWENAIDSGQKLPTLQEMNGLFYLITSQLAYIFQEGMSEYNSSTTYYTNSIVKQAGSTRLYKSLTDNNTGNLLTDNTNWSFLIDLNSIPTVPTGHIDYFAMSTAPNGYLKANGAAVSRTTYSSLFSVIGTTFGSGDGSTTFNLPDLRGYFIRDWADNGSIDSDRTFASMQNDALKETIITGYAWGAAGSVYTGTGFPTGSGTEYRQIILSGESETRPKNIALLACIKY